MDNSFHLSHTSLSKYEDEDIENTDNTNLNKIPHNTLNLNTTINSSGFVICDDRNMFVTTSDFPKNSKQNMCPYCKKLQKQFARHLELVHKNEEVKKFRFLPKGNLERKKIITILRRKGNFLYNTDSNLNKRDLIVSRRPNKKKNKQAIDFIPCAKCKGYFSKNNIRHHFKACTNKKNYQRNVKVLGRTVACHIHPVANSILRRLVFPVLREDSIIQLIRYDELIIRYGNNLCLKYRHQHQHDMIRSHLRLLGRFLFSLKEIDNTVTDFTSVYDPKTYDNCIKAVHNVAQFDDTTNTYKIPYNASTLGMLIKKVGFLLRSVCIKKNDVDKQSIVENFIKLFEQDYPISVSKAVHETQGHRSRQKRVVLPTIDDIKMLNTYLNDNRIKALNALKTDGFSITAWRVLAETTLISIMIFNRRRAGELERLLIENVANPVAISKEEAPELYKSLSKYVRISIRGKLGRTVPVLLNENMLQCIQMIIKYRKQAGVPEQNPYLFGISTMDKSRHKYLRACVLMRKYSSESGTEMPSSLRGTLLRKHIATICITLDISENKVNDLADFLVQHFTQETKSNHENEIQSGNDDNVNIKANNRKMLPLVTMKLRKRAQKEDIIDENNQTNGSNELDEEENSSEYSENENKAIKKRKRKLSPFGFKRRRVPKTKWSDDERTAVLSSFPTAIENMKLPSFRDIHQTKLKYPILNNRTVAQIKTWIHNQMKAQK